MAALSAEWWRGSKAARAGQMVRALQTAIARLLGYVVEERASDSRNTRISVLLSGKILVDGKAATPADVQRALKNAKAKRRTVWYYRESGGVGPPAEAIEVFKMIVEHKVPVSISTKSDFSDFVDDEGKSQPRR
jgi:hypothetical protein